jgi:hypothetical protein
MTFKPPAAFCYECGTATLRCHLNRTTDNHVICDWCAAADDTRRCDVCDVPRALVADPLDHEMVKVCGCSAQGIAWVRQAEQLIEEQRAEHVLDNLGDDTCDYDETCEEWWADTPPCVASAQSTDA